MSDIAAIKGVEVLNTEQGDFTGREQALRELTAWLSAPPDKKARVVTGGPGVGKSAVLTRLVTLANPETSRHVPLRGVSIDTIPPEKSIDVVVTACGKTLKQVVVEIAAQADLQAEDLNALLEALATRTSPLTIVIDAVDEAEEADVIAFCLLRSLSALATVRLLVGTRPELLGLIGYAHVELDLEDPRYAEPDDFLDYIMLRLLDDSSSPYFGNGQAAETVADEVALHVGSSFLMAWLICDTLANMPDVVDTTPEDWKEGFPNTIGEAFDWRLTRFGTDEPTVRALLLPLAYAPGAGWLAEDLWASLAAALAGRGSGHDMEEDRKRLLAQMGTLVVQTTENGRALYRLAHPALAEHLRQNQEAREIQSKILDTLLSQTPPRKDANGPDWLQAHPYIRKHLARHAAACGRLGELTSDLLYLICAEPDSLLAALELPENGAGPEEAYLYQAAARHFLPSTTQDEIAAYLEMAAHTGGLFSVVERITALPLHRPWAVLWARWRWEEPHRILRGHQRPPNTIALGELEDRTVLVSGSWDMTVRVWDLASGEPIGPALKFAGYVFSVAVGELYGRAIVVTGILEHNVPVREEAKNVHVWDLDSRHPIGPPLPSSIASGTAVALGELHGKPILAVGNDKGSVDIWDLAEGRVMGEPIWVCQSTINTIVLKTLQGRTLFFSPDSYWRSLDSGSDERQASGIWTAENSSVCPSGGQAIVPARLRSTKCGTKRSWFPAEQIRMCMYGTWITGSRLEGRCWGIRALSLRSQYGKNRTELSSFPAVKIRLCVCGI
ncbi:MAG: hypothetical protein JWL77_1954 [Chthonomonadaceae bacterium]|nr:hypothetical protein [Chthonomonadaceae bacterium]